MRGMDLPKVTRRSFLLASAAFPVGCALSRRGAERGAPSPEVRQPLAGQSWHYIKRDLFNGALIDTQVDQVATVGRTIDIDSHTESDKDEQGSSSGARAWLRKYFDHPRVGVALPSEIQGPWGMVLVDPHWSQVQVYESPIPLWPTRLEPGWQVHIRSKYRTSEDGAGLPWEQTMKAEAWETITVPAGQYKALRYKNSINFENSDVGRTNSVRRETIWLAPEVGRWVARESSGTYYLDDSVIDTPYNEDSYRWELLGWT
jgi:hypothetical protein